MPSRFSTTEKFYIPGERDNLEQGLFQKSDPKNENSNNTQVWETISTQKSYIAFLHLKN